MRRLTAGLTFATLTLAACGGGDGEGGADDTSDTTAETPAAAEPIEFPPAPDAPDGPNDEAAAEWTSLVDEIEAGSFDTADVVALADVADTRHAWLISDLLRFASDPVIVDVLIEQFDELTGTNLAENGSTFRSAWNETTNFLIAWDTPGPPDYRDLKGQLFTVVEPRWSPFFDDPDSTIDYRWLNWGGVFVDDRPLGTAEGCPNPGCIPALDDPRLVTADDGDWYDDDSIVFGVTEGDEAVAFPKNIMEIHEMVNITIGDRRFGIPYCTLCGSAQAFYTDEVPGGIETPVLRTSGLLSRSNKVMFDLNTFSVFDTFTGEAVNGPLREAGVVLEQNSVTVSTWGEWKAAHPDTTIVAEDGGIGRTYSTDPLRGRDDNGPIFPVGDIDDRLAVQEPVLGVVLDDGTPVAFPTEAVRSAMVDGDTAEFEGITIERDGGGFVAVVDGTEVATHQAFWFAWSQFHPDTLLWPDDA